MSTHTFFSIALPGTYTNADSAVYASCYTKQLNSEMSFSSPSHVNELLLIL